MCLILLAHDAHPDYRLILAANRDEFHARPTAPLAEWDDAPGMVGGRDLRSGGTWLAVRRGGRWAAVTNFRDPDEFGRTGPSRGRLVADYVRSDMAPESYVRDLASAAAAYSGFNLLVGDESSVWWTSNRAAADDVPSDLGPGIYGISNHLLDTPWPKVTRGKRELAAIANSPDLPSPDRLLDLLLDRSLAAEHDLPSTGVSRDLERALSAAFITTPEYGTRCSTALLIDRDGRTVIAERRFDPAGRETGETRMEL